VLCIYYIYTHTENFLSVSKNVTMRSSDMVYQLSNVYTV